LVYEAGTVALLGRGPRVVIGPNCVVGCAGVTGKLLGELDVSLDGVGTGTLLCAGIVIDPKYVVEGECTTGVLPLEEWNVWLDDDAGVVTLTLLGTGLDGVSKGTVGTG
jgi:hypothetical protein